MNSTIELLNFNDNDIINFTIEELLKSIIEDEDDSMTHDVLIIIPYLIIIIISLIGNLFVSYVCFTHQTTTNLSIGFLATSDLLITTFNIPFNMVRILFDQWPFGQVLCFLVPFVQAIAVYTSSWTIAIIAFFRLKRISLIGERINLNRKLILNVITIWCVSGIMALPHSIFSKVTSFVTFKQVTRCRVIYPESQYNIPLIISCEAFLTQYLIPLSIACCIYIKIGKIIVKQGKLIRTKGLLLHFKDYKKLLFIVYLIKKYYF